MWRWTCNESFFINWSIARWNRNRSLTRVWWNSTVIWFEFQQTRNFHRIKFHRITDRQSNELWQWTACDGITRKRLFPLLRNDHESMMKILFSNMARPHLLQLPKSYVSLTLTDSISPSRGQPLGSIRHWALLVLVTHWQVIKLRPWKEGEDSN